MITDKLQQSSFSLVGSKKCSKPSWFNAMIQVSPSGLVIGLLCSFYLLAI